MRTLPLEEATTMTTQQQQPQWQWQQQQQHSTGSAASVPTDGAVDSLPAVDAPPIGPLPVPTVQDGHWFDGNNIHSQIHGPVLPKIWK